MYRCLHFISASTVSPHWQTSRTARTFRSFTSERTRSATSMNCVGSETSPSYGAFGSRRTHVFSSTVTSKFERKASLAIASLFHQNQLVESALVICAAEGGFGQILVTIFLLRLLSVCNFSQPKAHDDTLRLSDCSCPLQVPLYRDTKFTPDTEIGQCRSSARRHGRGHEERHRVGAPARQRHCLRATPEHGILAGMHRLCERVMFKYFTPTLCLHFVQMTKYSNKDISGRRHEYVSVCRYPDPQDKSCGPVLLSSVASWHVNVKHVVAADDGLQRSGWVLRAAAAAAAGLVVHVRAGDRSSAAAAASAQPKVQSGAIRTGM